MVNQIRLRLTGNGGSGICELMEQPGQLRYRVTLEGERGEDVELLLQGRSPHMESVQRLAKAEVCSGYWQYEGELSGSYGKWGWLWAMRSGKPWLVGIFPEVSTPTEAARRMLLVEKTEDITMPQLLIPIPGLQMEKEGHNLRGKTPDGQFCRIQIGYAEQDPFQGRGCYWAGEGEKGLWIRWEDK